MKINPDIIEEMNILRLFNLEALDTGIKVHAGEAGSAVAQAAKRLYDKGFIDHEYGGYLTHRGIEAAQHIQRVLALLETD